MAVSLWMLVALVALVLVVYRRLRFTSGFQFPGPRALPLFGNCFSLLGSQADFFRLCEQLGLENPGGVFQLWVGMRPFVFLYNSQVIKPLVTSSLHIEKNYEYSLAKDWLGNGLISSKGEDWAKQRKMLTSCFHFNMLKEISQPVWKHGLVLLEKLQSSKSSSIDIVPLTKLLALDIICETSMGIDIGTQVNSNSEYPAAISRMTDILSYRFITPWVKPKFIFDITPSGKEYNKLLAKVQTFIDQIIVKRKHDLNMIQTSETHQTIDVINFTESNESTSEHSLLSEEQRSRVKSVKDSLKMESPGDYCKDCNRNVCRPESKTRGKGTQLAFLDLMLKMSQDDPTITDKDVKDQVNNFMFAGHDTISTAITFTLFILGHHMKWQDRIVEELDLECPDLLEEEPDTRLFMKGLPVLDRCIKEAMRVYPPSPMVGRTINSPLETPRGTLPSGTTAIIYTHLLHRDPAVFPEPAIFDPDRFLPERAPLDPFTYIPFSAGPRNCIGKSQAVLELKIILAMILRRFRITSVQSREELDLSFEVVLTNRKGIYLEFSPRY